MIIYNFEGMVSRKMKRLGLSYDGAVDEVIADGCEMMLKNSKSLTEFAKEHRTVFEKICDVVQEFINKIRGAISSLYGESTALHDEARFMELYSDELQKVFDKALSDALNASEATVDHNLQSNANKKTAEDGGSVQYSKGKSSYDYSKSFPEQIDDYKNGKFPKRDTFILGGTSEFYQKLGFNALPMIINKTHVDYALYNTKDANHFLGESLLKQLPEKINHPVAVFVSQTHPNTSVVALIKMNVNGNDVITPVFIDGIGKQNGVEIDANAVKTAHGRDNAIKKLLYEAIIDESNGKVSLFYINKKEALTLLHRAGLQLPGTLIPDGGFIHSIREKDSPVKPKYENVTETQQFERWFGDWQNHPQNASKIVNADGTPKIMYHGTKAENGEFWEFDYSKAKRKGGLGLRAMGKGNYFTSIKLDTNGKYDRVIPAYLDIKKPFEYQGGRSLSEQISEKLGIETTEMDYDTLQQVLRNAGYDGVVQYDKNGEISIAVTFDSEQIKSATDNIGTFDRGQKDIRYSKGDAYDPFEPYTPPAYATMPEYSAPLEVKYEYQGEGYTAVNGLKLFPKYSVDTARDYIMSELMLSEGKVALAKDLNEFYTFMATAERLTWEDIEERAGAIADRYLSRRSEKVSRDPRAQEALDTIRGARVTFDEKQKADAKALSGRFGKYRQSLMGRVNIVNGGISLDSQWQEWAELFPEYFSADTNSNDMPRVLLENIEKMKNSRADDGFSLSEEEERDRAVQLIYDSFRKVAIYARTKALAGTILNTFRKDSSPS